MYAAVKLEDLPAGWVRDPAGLGAPQGYEPCMVRGRAVTSAARTSEATFLVAPLLFKIDSGATSSSVFLTTFKRWANR